MASIVPELSLKAVYSCSMLGLVLLCTFGLQPTQTLSIKTSPVFESPAWCRVMAGESPLAASIVSAPYMAISASVSPSGQWVVMGLGRKNPPIETEYQNADLEMMEGSYVLRLFQLKNGVYQFAKSYTPEGTWRFDAWSKDESRLLLVAGPMIREGERQSGDRAYLLDTQAGTLKLVITYDYITNTKFSMDEKSAVISTLKYTNDEATNYQTVSTQIVRL